MTSRGVRGTRQVQGWIVSLCVFVGAAAALSVAAIPFFGGRESADAAGAAGRAAAPQDPSAWLSPLVSRLRASGYPWIGVTLEDRIAVVVGAAPDARAARRGAVAAQAALRVSPQAREALDLVLDGTFVGEAPPLSAPFARLSAQPGPEACAAAYAEAMDGRAIAFSPAGAQIAAASGPLLDLLAAISHRCQAHLVEVAGHTNEAPDSAQNLILSQRRASAVRAALIERGAPFTQLTAIGYGDEDPAALGLSSPDARASAIAFSVNPY